MICLTIPHSLSQSTSARTTIHYLVSDILRGYLLQPEELPPGRGELVLIVDDEAVVQQATRPLLEEYGDRTLIAQNGIGAIARYAEHKHDIDVVLLDIMMPGMDGFTAIYTLKKLNPHVKIIAASGLPTNQQSAFSAGADVFWLNPTQQKRY
jgi:two-component system, cell cycle sensor histidine kinase and response regulator CckA